MAQQEGHLFASHGAWYVRYWDQVSESDGSVKSIQRAKRLASVKDFPKKSEIIPIKNEFMMRLNRVGFRPEAGVNLIDFVENTYFPTIEKRLAPSTISGYRRLWRCHLKSRAVGVRVRDFRTVDGQLIMETLGELHGDRLAHRTYVWMKVLLSAVFTIAKQKGVYEGVNPMTGVSIPRGRKHGRKRLAYSLEEIEQHLAIFSSGTPIAIEQEDGSIYRPEISASMVRSLIATAGFAGLRQGELRGLRWEDDQRDVLYIRRSVWRSHVREETKTGEDEEDPGVVPIIGPLRRMLDLLRPANGHGFVFANTLGGPLDLENLADRTVKRVLKKQGLEWKGWHAYRRGLATNLSGLGVPDNVIQAILRHEDVSTTRRYIRPVPEQATEAMKRLESKLTPAAYSADDAHVANSA